MKGMTASAGEIAYLLESPARTDFNKCFLSDSDV